ncbi:MAG: SPOR domain-containing protein [Bacteroidales bacterium]|nr:SPOR domain-containing protein [Bacteroidales bacterium]
MNRICNAISQLLYEHDKVIVPGLGAFLRRDEGAQVNIVTNTFVKPSSVLVFDAQQREDNDLIASFLTTNEGMAEEEARQLLAQFVSDCFADLKTGKEVHLTGVGTLTRGNQQQWIFQSDPDIDYNTDAFGLSDFSVTPVFTCGKQDDWKAQVAQQIKDKNTPMTVDSKRVRRNFEMENDAPQPRRRGRGVLFTLLGLLLLAGIFVLLSYLKLIPVTLPFFKEPQPLVVYHTPGKPIDPELQQQLFAYYTYEAPAPETAAAEIAVDTTVVEAEQIPAEEVVPEPAKPETTAPSADTYRFDPPETSKVFIIGGCYSMEENAVTQIKTVREQGFANAFVMKRGSKYYVCYGHFATAEDAKEELAKVRPYNAKAWLLTKK